MIETRRFALDRRSEREVAALRLGSALLLLPAATYVLTTDAPIGAKGLAIIGIVGAVFWVLSWMRTRRHLHDAERYYLSMSDSGFTLCLGGDERSVTWASVRDVEVDEDRLVAVVSMQTGETLDIPPCWEGIGLERLVEILDEAARSARTPQPG